MDQKIINRSKEKIDYQDHNRLLKMHLSLSWLNQRDSALYELWCLAEDEDQKELIEFLIENFTFLDHNKLDTACKMIAQHITVNWKLEAKDTYLIATSDKSDPDGSQFFIQQLKNKFDDGNWNSNNIYNQLSFGLNKVPKDSNIILIDDFIGTGDTIQRKVIKTKKTLNKRGISAKIYIVSLAAMYFAEEKLDALCHPYFSPIYLKKGISELFAEEKRELMKIAMLALEEKLESKINNSLLPNFGYKGSETLFSIGFSNIPNNVFPIFWWPKLKGGQGRDTLFSRL